MKDYSVQALSRDEFERLKEHASKTPDFVFLGSHGTGDSTGTWRLFSALPVETVSCLTGSDVRTACDQLTELNRQFAIPQHPGVPSGGIFGMMSYELGYLSEKRLAERCPAVPVPVLQAGLYLWTACYNVRTGACVLWHHATCPDAVLDQLRAWRSTPVSADSKGWSVTQGFRPTQSPESFRQGVRRIKDYISAGDCYQANLSQEFTAHFQGDPWLAFKALTEANPTPYSAFVKAGGYSVLSVSPERFLEIDGGLVKTSPIKGTRPRGATPEADRALAKELETSVKDRAENLMIVDLLRNDLSVHAKTGSVRVDELFALESYRNVHHLVSHIRAELKADVSPLTALLDAFPGGSITGAPKIRAMEIIRELEPHWRGPYCGSVFYYGLDGRLDSSIAIRTLLCDDQGTIRCWGGGGIVADSDPEAEYQETLAKVGPLMRFLEDLSL